MRQCSEHGATVLARSPADSDGLLKELCSFPLETALGSPLPSLLPPEKFWPFVLGRHSGAQSSVIQIDYLLEQNSLEGHVYTNRITYSHQ